MGELLTQSHGHARPFKAAASLDPSGSVMPASATEAATRANRQAGRIAEDLDAVLELGMPVVRCSRWINSY